MHPWFFSIGRLHFGQGLVFARIHVIFSLSALFLTIHCRTVSQSTGLWASSLQVKQKALPQAQCTSMGSPGASISASAALVHPGAVHQARRLLSSTKLRTENSRYLAAWDSSQASSTRGVGTTALHEGSGQRRSRQEGPESTAAWAYPCQQAGQK